MAQIPSVTCKKCPTLTQMLVKAPDQKGRLQDYCAASVFVQVLMLQAYGFDDQSFSQISFQKTVSSQEHAQCHQHLINVAIRYCGTLYNVDPTYKYYLIRLINSCYLLRSIAMWFISSFNLQLL